MELNHKKQTLGKGGCDERVCEKKEGAWMVACRRTRRGGRKENGSTSESETSVVSFDSTVSTASAVSERRKRRKAFLKSHSSGEDSGATARKKKKEEKPTAPRRVRARPDTLPPEEEIRGELTNLPTAEIGAEVTRQVDEIERVAKTSSNLKGTYVRQLKLAARTVKVATVELTLRTQADKEIREIRAESNSLRERVRLLQEEVERLRATVPHEGKQPSFTHPVGETVAVSPVTGRSGRILEETAARPAALPSQPAGHSTGEDMIVRIGRMVDAKLEALRADLTTGPMTRPPLQHERKAETATAKERKKGEGKGKEKEKENGKKSQEKGKGKQKKKDHSTAAASTPATPTESETRQAPDTWAKVVGRKAKTCAQKAASPALKATATTAKASARPKPGKGPQQKNAKDGPVQKKKGGGGGSKPRIPRPPRSAAVTVTLPQGSQHRYATIMAAARKKIDLAAVGIESLRMKKAMTGALLLEVTGKDGGAKADALASKMSEVLAPTGVKISRPTKTSEVRITGLEDSVSPEEIATAIAAASGCKPEEIRVGPIRSSERRLGSAWVRCPQVAAKKIVEEGHVKVGWSTARVILLQQRPLQCYKCLEQGHVRAKCPNDVDRSGRCYVCGIEGHRARDCAASSPTCPLCSDLGRPATHRMGGKACSPRGLGKKKKDGGNPPPLFPQTASRRKEDEASSKPTPALPEVEGVKAMATPGHPTEVAETSVGIVTAPVEVAAMNGHEEAMDTTAP